MVEETLDELETQQDDSSTSDTGEDTSESDKSQTVPIGRFKEVYSKTKELEQQIQDLKGKESDKGLSQEEQKELQAKNYLKGLLKETLDEQKQHEEQATQEEQNKFNEEVDEQLSVHTDVNRDDFLKFVEDKGEEYGTTSVKGAMKLYRDLNNLKKSASEEVKEDLSKKPNLPSHEGGSSESHVDDSKKSYQQIVEEATREAEKGRK